MIKLLGYNVFEQIHTGKRTLVYRGVRDADQMPVIVKILSKKYPTVQEITSIKHEYKITYMQRMIISRKINHSLFYALRYYIKEN